MRKNSRNTPEREITADLRNIREMSSLRLIFLTAIFFTLFDNFAFFRSLTATYPVSPGNIPFLISLVTFLVFLIVILFSLFCFRYTTKPILITVLIISSIAAYYMDTYNIVIDSTMIQNIMETDTGEVRDLLTARMFLYLFFAGILPSIIIYKIKIRYKPLIKELLTKLIVVITSILIILVLVLSMSDFYTSFIRAHQKIRRYTNPVTYIYYTGRYISENMDKGEVQVNPIGTDAKISETDNDRELVILVVGEAARADRFSLNGYHKETNPLLEKEDVINFPDMHSCGTSTAVSVPCMFSIFKRAEYSENRAKHTYNILDVLQKAGVNILWRENNSSSKGVADRIPFENYKTPENNTVCDVECRDEGMLVGLQEYINSKKTGDILIVLHQRGNHGPLYYKRYPQSFEKFKPACRSNELQECTREELDNVYDNAILYTDYFLSKVIALLKQNSQFETAMFYVSDHGESLGENNLYLHGIPYFMAPETQTHIPAIMWLGQNFEINREILKKIAKEGYSHDNLFHTLLGLMEVDTSLYDKNMDMLKPAKDISLAEESGSLKNNEE